MSSKKRSFEANDPRGIFLQAEAFFESSIFINNKGLKHVINRTEIAENIIAVEKINLAFAFELYLKCLLAIESGKYVEGHNLLTLFEYLSPEMQKEIIDQHNNGIIYGPAYFVLQNLNKSDDDDFLSTLRSISNTFTDLRYMFEKSRHGFYDFGFTMKFVRDKILRLRPDFAIQ